MTGFLFQFKEVLIEAFGGVETRFSQSVKSFIKVTEPFLRCFVYDAKRSHDLKLLLSCGSSPSAFINDYQSDPLLFGQKNRVPLSWVESDGEGARKMNRLHLEPGRAVPNPFSYSFRRLFPLKLRKNGGRNQHLIEESGENINEACQNKIVQRGGVGGDNHFELWASM